MICRDPNVSDVRPAVWHDETNPAPAPAQPAAAAPTAAPLGQRRPHVRQSGRECRRVARHHAGHHGHRHRRDRHDGDRDGRRLAPQQRPRDQRAGREEGSRQRRDERVKPVDIDTLNIAGREIHKVRAGIVPDGAGMLLGLPILAQLSSKVSFDLPNAKLTFL